MSFTRRSRVLRRGPGRKPARQASQLRRPEELETRVAPSETLSSLLASAWISTPADVPAQVAENLPVDGSHMASGKLSRQSRWRAESSARFLENFGAWRGVGTAVAERLEAEPVRWSPILPFVSQPRPQALDVSADLRVWEGPSETDAGAVGLASGSHNSAAGERVWGPAPAGGGSTRAQLGPVPNTAVWIPAVEPQVAPTPAPRSSGEEMARASGGGDAPNTDSPVAPPPAAPAALSAKKANFVNPAGVDWADVALNLQTDVTSGKVKLPPGKARSTNDGSSATPSANDGSSATPSANESLATEPALSTGESTSEPDIVLPAEVDAAFNSLTDYLIGNAGRGMDALQRELFKSYGRELKGDKPDKPDKPEKVDKGDNGRGIGGRSFTPTSRATTTATGTGTGSCGGSTSTGNTPPVAVADGPFYVPLQAFFGTPLLQSGVTASILQNDFDCNGDKLTYMITKFPQNGKASMKVDGTFSYMPNGKHTGVDVFWYVVHDGKINSAPVPVWVYTIGADLDADTDNNIMLERSDTEETLEFNNPGKVLIHGISDIRNLDRTPIVQSLAGVQQLASTNLEGWSLRLVPPTNASTTIDYFAKETGTTKPTALTMTVPALMEKEATEGNQTLFAKPSGSFTGTVEYKLQLLTPLKNVFHTDFVYMTAITAPTFTAFRPQTKTDASTHYADPHYDMFRRREIPQLELQQKGVGIRPNRDIATELPAQEDDLIEVAIKNMSPVSGVGVRAVRSSDAFLHLWEKPGAAMTELDLFDRFGKKSGVVYPIEADITKFITSGYNTLWMEWADTGNLTQFGPFSADIQFELFSTSNNQVLYRTATTEFHRFQSIVIVYAGEFQVPDDSANIAQPGIIDIAIRLFEEGYDVYMYDEPDLLPTDSSLGPFTSAEARKQLQAAINLRGVTDVAMVGYSHGGGMVYQTSRDLARWTADGTLRNPWNLAMTGYIDAVGWYNTSAEIRRPLGSQWHVGVYQMNETLQGGPSGGDIDLDLTLQGLDHTSIDDNANVKSLMINHLKRAISP